MVQGSCPSSVQLERSSGHMNCPVGFRSIHIVAQGAVSARSLQKGWTLIKEEDVDT